MKKFYVVKAFPNLLNMALIRKTEWVPMDGKMWAQFICEDGFIRTFTDQEVEPAPTEMF